MKQYKTVKEIAQEWSLTTRAIRNMCEQGKIKGAEKIGRDWMLPQDVIRPIDGRIVSGKYKK